jgi:hypothetical protein
VKTGNRSGIAFQGNSPISGLHFICETSIFVLTYHSFSLTKMKTRDAVKAQRPIPVWQPAGKVESIMNQVRKLTCELHALQHELYSELSEEDGSRRQDSPLRQAPACEDLKSLQTAADQLRRVLWFYLDLASHAANATEQDESRTTEEWLLQHPRHEPAMVEQQPFLEPGSFFERLNLVIDGYMQQRGITRNGKAVKP